MDTSPMNVLKNTVAPAFDKNRVVGYSISALNAVTVEWIVRYLMKSRRPLVEMMAAHAISPSLEGVVAYFKIASLKDGSVMEQATTGLSRGVPVMLGYWLWSIVQSGFSFGFPRFMEILIVLGSRGLSQTELSFLYQFLPTTIQGQLNEHDLQSGRARYKSNVKFS